MPTATELASLIAIEKERRRRLGMLVEEATFDWYGPDCGCPPEGRKKGGECPSHPRARAKQHPPPGDWRIWYIETGRGWGKTETAARYVNQLVHEKQARRFSLVGATAGDVNKTMVGSLAESDGIIGTCRPCYEVEHQISKRRVVWFEPGSGKKKILAVATLYSADEPERLRGHNTEIAWCDELASWRRPDAWRNLMLGLRKGSARCVVSTTPKVRPWLRKIKARPSTVITKGSTYENRANLAEEWFSDIVTEFEGTSAGERELMGIDKDEAVGALWTLKLLDASRIDRSELPDFERVVVSIDPSVADPNADPDSDTAECGITVGGMAHQLHPTLDEVPHGYVLADYSLKAHPNVWAHAAVDAYHRHGADMIVAEVNNGGAMVAAVIQSIDPSVPVKCLHASRGKHTRAEPIASFYEQGRIKHVRGNDFSKLEDQMVTWVPGLKSPDRMDSLVWLMTELLTEGVPLTMGPNLLAGYRG